MAEIVFDGIADERQSEVLTFTARDIAEPLRLMPQQVCCLRGLRPG